MPPTPPPAKPPTAALSDAARASSLALVLRLLRIAWRYKLGSIKIIALQVVLLAMALSGLGLTGLGVDVIKSGFDRASTARYPLGISPPAGWSTMQQVFAIASAIFVIAALRFALDRWALVSKAELVQDIVVDLRARVYDKLQRLSFRFFDANESGSIINRVTGDVQAVRMFVDAVLIEILMLLISLVFFLGYMLSLHVWLTVWCLITTPLLWVLTAYFSKLVKPAYRTNRELFDRAVRVLSENAQGVHVVKGFSRQLDEVEKFRTASQAVTDQKHWIFGRVSVFVPLISFVPQINLVVLLGYGGYLTVYDPSFTFGSGLIVFASLLQQFSTQVGNIAQIANSLQQSLTGAQRVFEVLDSPVEVQSPPNAVPLPRARGHIRLERVSFCYADGTEALRNVDLEVQPGECVAILGATGSGKSTLMSLIPRFYDPTDGRVLIDGVDARRYDLDDLRRNVGIVFQESFLFSNTVAANIAFGHPEATPEMIERAATIASAHGFITRELPRGYDSLLTEAGSNLSGGQRQRIAIARAILTEPPILLMDDPTAAIDPETEHEIMGAINAALTGRTTFIVAHRLSTLKRADRVIVMEHGRIIQTGTHDELMDSSGHYRKVARLQIADEESKRLLGLPTGGAA